MEEELLGKPFEPIIHGPEGVWPECPIEECFLTGKPVQREGAHPRWGGYFSFHAFPVHNLAGQVERVVYYEKDATEEKRLEQRLHQSERLKALGTLAAGIAHEIRNPLATINFNAQMLNRELELGPLQRQMFSDLLGEVKKIDGIVQQVLHFARPREPQFLANRLDEVVTYCFDLSKVYLRKANIEVSMDLAEDLPAITMDFNQISQVVMNLLINAIEAMPEGGRLSVGIERSETPPALILWVRDTGVGILEEDKNRIFDPFFTRKPEGTGLGLSISRQILERHGAYIEVESLSGKGTVIRVIFPLLNLGALGEKCV
jgi:signal transduction histidine kinase